ncbi:MAG TPA: glucose-1-phosphate cytidylyltransferase [Humidesulfovibrio sp.]|uniref:glucose-1-phosphate cytidylyltransferase n=1 Tax=Humidesulfovibrio sp. TaxID=2910988 RepID=UPI002C1E05CA|nr:glucose-1-phosphate cytidylyltransferase [Humidesulfovibrio sp.]HWR02774.1 glucose-1-phosphate cytidylyltransferase [Humidesulfovibrio sp.]
MEVVLLCGGLGTRLREETEFRPKPMVNIGPRPILWHIMKVFASQGHQDFVLALGYKGEMIKDYFLNYEAMNNDVTIELGKPDKALLHSCHEECGWKITLADTGEKALKGARLKKIEKYVKGDTFLLTYGDGVANVDIEKLVAFHKSHGKMVTLTGVNPASRFGELKLDGDRVTRFHEKPTGPGQGTDAFINGGYMVMNRAIFDRVTDDDSCDLEYGPLEALAEEGQLMVYRHHGFWACMDTLRDTEYLNKLWTEGRAGWKVW